ncbi:hypothetical protein [Zeaxanthinibacter enoshimensis]|uniref:Uncharacterized protein n=1 Tax=Zeaxanthinibacter enoshimensis TaxID=392009 RepID=A0A4R6TTJ0_9FLAO|nr:hypothetical protein [Zeaxanthinibacter enoshimensis]TDQ33239.1 hypothetical protein CLV82_1077 [Zeaxanthinibacter enoshimensis]
MIIYITLGIAFALAGLLIFALGAFQDTSDESDLAYNEQEVLKPVFEEEYMEIPLEQVVIADNTDASLKALSEKIRNFKQRNAFYRNSEFRFMDGSENNY